MKVAEAVDVFKRFLLKRGLDLAHAAPVPAFEALLDWYVAERAEETDLTEDGDMLLFQWGTYDWGKGKSFELDLTRQFITRDEEDEPRIDQLHLTFHYPPEADFGTLEQGNRWCPHPDEAGIFGEFVRDSAALREATRARPRKVELDQEQV